MKHFLAGIFNKYIKTKVFANFVNLSSIQVSNALLIVLIYRLIGIEKSGFVGFASTFAGLSGIIINYGTSQSGVKDVVMAKNNPEEMARVFYNTLFIRGIIFVLFLILFFFLQWLNIKYYHFMLLAIPIVFSEVVNPMFFYLGEEKLSNYNLVNIISNISIVVLVIFLIRGPDDSIWINFIIGLVNTTAYCCLLIYAIIRFRIRFVKPHTKDLLKMANQNFFLTGNNISVQLQQAVMIFALGKWGNASLLGGYWLCDKIVWSSRVLVMTISNAIYPKAARLYFEGYLHWLKFMKRTKKLIALLFFVFSLTLFFGSELIIHIIVGSADPGIVSLLRIMAFVPTLAALNCLNVVDLLLKRDNISIFRIAMILLGIAICLSVLLASSNQTQLLGFYVLFIDFCALMMYEYAIKKSAAEYAGS